MVESYLRYCATFPNDGFGPSTSFRISLELVDNNMAKASARHILVSTEEECLDLKKRIAEGEDFGALAAAHSSCPSGQQGGALGSFGPGQMVPEFDKAVFGGEVGDVQGPVKTQFGFHLLEVTERTE